MGLVSYPFLCDYLFFGVGFFLVPFSVILKTFFGVGGGPK